MGVCLPIVHEGGSRYAFTVTKHTYLGDGTSWGFGARTRAGRGHGVRWGGCERCTKGGNVTKHTYLVDVLGARGQ